MQNIITSIKKITLLIAIILCSLSTLRAQKVSKFKVIALYENGGHHLDYSKAAVVWLNKQAEENNFAIDYIQNTDKIDSAFLSNYQLFIQLDYPPYAWKDKAVKAFENYVDNGKGGWIGFHHATLLGEFDGYGLWPWFYKFMGQIKFKNYIAKFAKGKVNVEDHKHPIMKGVSPSFWVEKEEWYTYDKSPRPNVKVLASVDEGTYEPKDGITMGDHPVVWTNPAYTSRNVYIFMGHSPILFESKDYTTLFKNAIFWAVGKK
ncbi:ThuA domain-containing protein [Pedobacter sp. UC225_61]|uniref:ThuA domain-containing protein n=1 Tax=Pedobacter sp. UC225_61 TaxID=3374623 RepID=UPI00379E3A77